MNFKLLPEYAPYRKYYDASVPVILILLNLSLGVSLDEADYSEKLETAINAILVLVIPIIVQMRSNAPLSEDGQ